MLAVDILVPSHFTDESIGSSIPLVILSDTETEIALEVVAIVVVSPASVLGTTVHLDSESGPYKDPPSSDHALVAP
ncbi:hypothetical protein Tco_1288396, partial [Tanacetum coccineum]